MFDVFLSHSSLDKPAVEQLAVRLREARLEPFLDTWHLIPGTRWQPAIEKALAGCATAAVFIGPSGVGPWHNEEMRVALDRAARSRDDYRVIPVLLPGSTSEHLEGFLAQRTWVDFRGGLDSASAFARLVAGIQGQAPASDPFHLPDEPAPYRGLLPFDKDHSAFFFGREADIQRVVEKLRAHAFVAVVGPSGAGKSSLVQGGVLPRLESSDQGPGQRPLIRVMRPGERPLHALADQLATLLPAQYRLEQARVLRAQLASSPDGLRSAVATLTAERHEPFVLAVDQLEELLTHAPDTAPSAEVDAFLANLHDTVTHGRGAIRVVATLRADFFERCLGLPALRELLQDRQVLLGGLDEAALRDAILRPAQQVGAFLEKGLVSAILKDASREPGALPLLEDALHGLWRARRGAWLTLAAYERSGGISKALGLRAQARYESLSPEERETAKRVLLRLTALGEGAEDTRRRVARAELSFPGVPEARVEQVLQVLSGPEARLLVLDKDTVEVAHEVLIRGWPTLRKWVDEDRRPLRVQRRLAEAALEWGEKGGDPSYLYSGARLLDAEELCTSKPELLNHRERGFLEASARVRDEQQRVEQEQARRLLEETEARRKAEAESADTLRELLAEARRERELAFSRELTTNALVSVKEDPQRALLLLQAAQRLVPGEHFEQVLSAWANEPCRLVLRGHEGPVEAASFSPDGTRVLTASRDGTARLWDVASGKSLAVLDGHTKAVTAAAFSPDGTRILTASHDHTARLWDSASGRPLATLEGHLGTVMAAAFSPDGTRTLTASVDGTARLWDSASGQPLATLTGHSDWVTQAVFTPDGTRALTASKDGTTGLWDLASGKQLATLSRHIDRVTVAAFSPDGTRALTASMNGTICLWELASEQLLAPLSGHSDRVTAAAFSPDGTRAMTASKDGTARIWNSASGKPLLAILTGHLQEVWAAAFSPDGTRALTASRDGTARLWDSASGKHLAPLSGHLGWVMAAAFSPDGTRAVTASGDGTARLWELASGKPLAILSGHSIGRTAVAFSHDGARAMTASKDGTACLWDSASGKPLATLEGHSETVLVAAFNPDGTRAMTASKDGTARLWDVPSGTPLAILSGHSIGVTAASFSPDGTRALIASWDGTARLWDVASGNHLAIHSGHTKAVTAAAFSPDGTRALTASIDGTARLWDVASGEHLATLSGHSNRVIAAAFNPNGTRALTASMDGTARLWDLTSGQALATLTGHSNTVTAAAFSPDGNRALTASHDHTARIWDLASGKPLATLAGHSDRVTAAAFSPDGTRAFTAAADGTARIWDAVSGKPLATLFGHSKAVTAACFSPDGQRCLTASNDGTARLWPSWRWDPVEFMRLDVGRELTCEERRIYLHEDIQCPGDQEPAAQSQR